MDRPPADRTPAVVLVTRPGAADTGIGRYARAMYEGLRTRGVPVRRVTPLVPPRRHAATRLLDRLGMDAPAFLQTYPAWLPQPPAAVTHLTSQNLAVPLLWRRPSGRLVVTVHDIIPHLLRHDPALRPARWAARLADRLAMAGLRHADILIADSAHTRQTLIAHLGLPPERIAVVPLGVDHDRFRPRPVGAAARARYGLRPDQPVILTVGAEGRRKNLPALLAALAIVHRTLPDAVLLKVGRPQAPDERARLLAEAQALGVAGALRFTGAVPAADLPALYCLADVFVLPSLHEGFGLPLLEAMACGTPVVYARAAALPEVAGPAGLPVAPGRDMAAALAQALLALLTSPEERHRQALAGQRQAALFSWDQTVTQTLWLYGAGGGGRA